MSNDNQSELKTKHITFGFVIAWILAVVVGIPGIMMLFEHQVGAGILFILMALVALPPANSFIKEKTNFSLSNGLRVAAVVVLFAIAAVVISKGTPATTAVSVPAQNETGSTAQVQATAEKSTPAATEAQPDATQTPTPAPSSTAMQTLLDVSGSGTKTTESFTAAGAWNLVWSYDCSNFASQGNFEVTTYDNGGQPDFSINPVNELGASGSDTEYYHQGGTYYLEVDSECSWHIQVKG
jgi:hypothetical protein